MFTLQKHPDAPEFSVVLGNPRVREGADAPRVEHTAIGSALALEFSITKAMRPKAIDIIEYVIMPDHAHVLLRVKIRLTYSVTKIVSAIESATTTRCRKNGLIAADAPLFLGRGLNDKIVFDEERLETLINYIRDNPRRLLIKREFPDLFRRNLSIKINDDTLDCVGNLFLLRKPMVAVHVRHHWTRQQNAEYKKQCLALSRMGAVLIFPFIHPVENEIRKTALENGGEIIHIQDQGFSERFKPTGRSFDTCAEGRLLLICKSGTPEYRRDMSYATASRLNALAERLASLSPATPMTLSLPR